MEFTQIELPARRFGCNRNNANFIAKHLPQLLFLMSLLQKHDAEEKNEKTSVIACNYLLKTLAYRTCTVHESKINFCVQFSRLTIFFFLCF